MTALSYYVSLRSEILEIISGVKNSNGYLTWDNTTPNYLIKSRLERVPSDSILRARQFGVYLVTRYSSCLNPKHEGYPIDNSYGLPIRYRDPKYIWEGDQLFQGLRRSTCPCSKNNKRAENWVMDDIIFDGTSNLEECRRIASILGDISDAIDAARDNKPRSGIRENLLKSVLRLNDAILPKSIDDYISEMSDDRLEDSARRVTVCSNIR